MKGKTLLLSLLAALGGCPLLGKVTGSEPLCRASDLKSDADLELMPDQTVILTTCEAGRSVTRDRRGRIVTREWRDKVTCDLRDIAEASRIPSVRTCLRGR